MRRLRELSLALASMTALVALLMIRPDLQRLAPQNRLPEVDIVILVLALAMAYLTVRWAIEAMFKTPHSVVVAWRGTISWALYILAALLVAGAMNVNLSGLLVGGAILGVVVAVGAQTSLSNLFAGLLLVITRPYATGNWVLMRNWFTPASEYEGRIINIGAIYTTISTADRTVRIPNSVVITAVLVLDEPPVKVDLTVELGPSQQVDSLPQIIAQELLLGDEDRVTLTPTTLAASDKSNSSYRLVIRSHRTVATTKVADMLRGLQSPPEVSDRS